VPAIGLLISLIVVAAQWRILSAEALMFDDGEYLLENPLVRDPSWRSTWRFFSEVFEPSSVRGYYQPLAMVSLMMDCALGGGPANLVPFRITSLALHVANTLLLFWMLLILFEQPWAALAGALFFGLHPGCVESTAWLADRKTLLASFFGFGTIIAYLRYTGHPHRLRQAGSGNARAPASESMNQTPGGARPLSPLAPRRAAYGAALVLFVLALLSKPTVMPLPFLLLILDWWPLDRLGRRSVIEKVPFLLMAGGSAVITYVSQSRTAGVFAAEAYPLYGRLLVFCHNVVFYPVKVLLPIGLSAHYPFPEPVALSNPWVLAGVVAAAGLPVLLVLSLRWTRSVAAGGLFFYVALLPAMGIVGFTPAIAADRFTYLAKSGLILPICCWLARGLSVSPRGQGGRLAGLVAALLGVLAVEAYLTRAYLGHWRETETFARYLVAHAPGSSYLRTNLGKILAGKGRSDEALEQFRLAVEMGKEPEAHLAIAVRAASEGRVADAERHLLEAARLDPSNAVVQTNLGLVTQRLGRTREATAYFERAVTLRPENAVYRLRLAEALRAEGRMAEAAEQHEAWRRLRGEGEPADVAPDPPAPRR